LGYNGWPASAFPVLTVIDAVPVVINIKSTVGRNFYRQAVETPEVIQWRLAVPTMPAYNACG
jgi:hypothetical protein